MGCACVRTTKQSNICLKQDAHTTERVKSLITRFAHVRSAEWALRVSLCRGAEPKASTNGACGSGNAASVPCDLITCHTPTTAGMMASSCLHSQRGISCSRPHRSRQPRSVVRCYDPQNPVTSVNNPSVNKTCSFRPCIDIHKARTLACCACLCKPCTHDKPFPWLQGQVKQIVGSSLSGSSS